MLRPVLAVMHRTYGSHAAQTMRCSNALALSLNAQQKYAEAESLFRITLKAQTQVLGAEHRSTLATASNLTLALVYQNQKNYEETEIIARSTHASFARVLGREHPSTLTAATTIALIHCQQENWHAAISQFLVTFEIQQRVFGPDHPHTQLTIENMTAYPELIAELQTRDYHDSLLSAVVVLPCSLEEAEEAVTIIQRAFRKFRK